MLVEFQAEEGCGVFGDVGEGLEEEAEVDGEGHEKGHDDVGCEARVHVFLFGLRGFSQVHVEGNEHVVVEGDDAGHDADEGEPEVE